MKTYTIVVDMINGFIKEGALHDKNILGIVPNIKKILDTNIKKDEQYVFIRDCHTSQAVEFENFPSHCVDGTSETEIIDEFASYLDCSIDVIEKNSTNAFWAMKERGLISNITLMRNVERIVITGCCTDICVLHLALSLKTYLNEQNISGIEVVVIEDAVDTYTIPEIHESEAYNQIAIQLMKVAGIKIMKTEDIINGI